MKYIYTKLNFTEDLLRAIYLLIERLFVVFFVYCIISCANKERRTDPHAGESATGQINTLNDKTIDKSQSGNFAGKMQIIDVASNSLLKVRSTKKVPIINEKLSLVSNDSKIGIYGVGLVKKINFVNECELECDSKSEFEMEIISISPRLTARVGDFVSELDLSREQENYLGGTDRLVIMSSDTTSSRYKALVTQGISIGDTAETLWKDEFLITYYGQLTYGVYDYLSLGTVLPLNATGALNGSLKLRFYRTNTNILSTGLTYTKIPNSDSSSLNVNFMWDSISNNDLITHNFITLAVVSFNNAEDVTAIKSIGTSSLQTGYEFVLNDWSRILVGPNFNFEKKSVGGYFSYLKIWDKTHLQFSINSTNIRSLKLSPTDGYYVFFDAYWRY